MLHFSQSNNAFYDDTISSSLPADAVAITADQHTALLNAQSAGATIGSDANGHPVAVQPGLVQLQAAQVRVLSEACRSAITGGFLSSALGGACRYPSSPNDQQNLSDAAAGALASGANSSFATPLWCAVASLWSFTPHAAAQVQQVHADWLAFRVTQQSKLLGLTDQVNAAPNAAAVAAITW